MNIFTPDNIRTSGAAESKEAALRAVADLAVERGYSSDADGVLEGLLAREAQISTALMDGMAIPHTKHAAVTEPALIVWRFDESIDWGDDVVNVLVAMLVPEADAGTTHLQLLAKVSRALIDDDVRQVLSGGSADEIHAALAARIA